MGATTFFQTQAGADVREAFRQARDAAGWENGHGYSGSLAEKDDYVVIETAELVTPDEAEQIAYRLIEKQDPRIDDKWGPAGAIRTHDADTGFGWLFFGWASS